MKDKIDYNSCFKRVYYSLYSNSNTSRAERIVSDVTKILLAKLVYERNNTIPDKLLSGEDIIGILKENYPKSTEEFDGFALSDTSIQEVLDILWGISLKDAPANIIGDAFQSMIGPGIRGDKGQFFTPQELVDCMTSIVKPTNGMTIIDPACGTGGFLNAAYNYVSAKNKNSNINLIGIDKDRDMADIAFATSEIITGGKSTVFHGNSLEIVKDDSEFHNLIGSADLVLTNPPFGAKIGITDKELLSQFEFGHNWTYSEKENAWYQLDSIVGSQVPQVLFIELCVKLLKKGGVLAIVLPEGIFGNKSLGYIWTYLKNAGNIIAMIDCPRNTFQPSTDTKTNVLFFQKGAKYTDQIKVSVAKKCGHDKRGRVLLSNGDPVPNDFIQISESFEKDNDIWKIVSLHGNYFVPRYLYGGERLGNSEKNITIGEMLDRGYLKRKSGKEVGSEAYGTGDIPFVRTSDLINFEIASDPTNAVSEEIYNQYAEQQNLEEGDILFIADGRYRIGKTAIITKYNKKCLIQSHIEILSLTEKAPISPYEFLYLLNTDETQEQIRDLIFIQSTLGTLGNRVKQISVRIPERDEKWKKTIDGFEQNIEIRARCLAQLQENEHMIEL